MVLAISGLLWLHLHGSRKFFHGCRCFFSVLVASGLLPTVVVGSSLTCGFDFRDLP